MGRPLALLLSMGLLTCLAFEARAAADPLPSWRDTPTKRAIVGFVDRITDPKSEDFVPPGDRIATFDNDGTLWCEKPLYIHLEALADRFEELAAADPGLKRRQPYKAILNKDMAYLFQLYEHAAFDTLVGQLMAVPFGGMTVGDYEAWNRSWLSSWKHPRFDVGYEGLIYQPMLELLELLRANQFQVHIYTADEGAFLGLVSEELYGIPPSNVSGTSVRLEYIVEEGKPEIVRTYQAAYLDNWDAKPRLIQQQLKKRPILAAGNSNGDLQMLQYVAVQPRRALALLLHHTDAEREYRYDKHTDKVMPLARKEGWTVIDMKADWKTVFASE